MSAPGPDGVVCEHGCDAWSVDADCPQHGRPKTTGPIVACDNAIEHYDRELEHLAEAERRLLDRLMKNRQQQEELRRARLGWRNARDTLAAAQRQAITDSGP